MFDQGGELKDIVSALQVTPDEVRRLYQDWQSLARRSAARAASRRAPASSTRTRAPTRPSRAPWPKPPRSPSHPTHKPKK